MKLGALNCHGLKEKLDCPEVLDLIESCDVFGVCETWLNEGDCRDVYIPNYKFYPLNRKKSKGTLVRGGLGVFIKTKLKEHIKVLYDISCENHLWCKLDKKYFGYHDDVYIGIVYIPPEYSTRERKLNIDHFKQLKETTSKIDSDNIVLMGDFNARTGNLDDVLLAEKHEEIPQMDFYSGIETKRVNQDPNTNKYGKRLVDYCIATKSFIANGRTLGDLQGKLTCHQPKGSSAVDYAVFSENMLPFLLSFRVLDPSTGSDHSPITYEIETPYEKQKSPPSNTTPTKRRIQWNEKNKAIFLKRIGSRQCEESAQEINLLLGGHTGDSQSSIDEALGKFTDMLTPCIPDNHKKQKSKNKKQRPKKWYDSSCHEMGKRLKNVAKLYAKSPTNPHLRGSLCKTRKEYRKLLKLKKNGIQK